MRDSHTNRMGNGDGGSRVSQARLGDNNPGRSKAGGVTLVVGVV